jgi:hypothetical protein
MTKFLSNHMVVISRRRERCDLCGRGGYSDLGGMGVGVGVGMSILLTHRHGIPFDLAIARVKSQMGTEKGQISTTVNGERGEQTRPVLQWAQWPPRYRTSVCCLLYAASCLLPTGLRTRQAISSRCRLFAALSPSSPQQYITAHPPASCLIVPQLHFSPPPSHPRPNHISHNACR